MLWKRELFNDRILSMFPMKCCVLRQQMSLHFFARTNTGTQRQTHWWFSQSYLWMACRQRRDWLSSKHLFRIPRNSSLSQLSFISSWKLHSARASAVKKLQKTVRGQEKEARSLTCVLREAAFELYEQANEGRFTKRHRNGFRGFCKTKKPTALEAKGPQQGWSWREEYEDRRDES